MRVNILGAAVMQGRRRFLHGPGPAAPMICRAPAGKLAPIPGGSLPRPCSGGSAGNYGGGLLGELSAGPAIAERIFARDFLHEKNAGKTAHVLSDLPGVFSVLLKSGGFFSLHPLHYGLQDIPL